MCSLRENASFIYSKFSTFRLQTEAARRQGRTPISSNLAAAWRQRDVPHHGIAQTDIGGMLRTPQPLGIARMLVERQKPLKSGPRPLLVLARRVERAAPIGLVHRQMPCGIMVGGTRRSSGITLAAEKLGGGEQRRHAAAAPAAAS